MYYNLKVAFVWVFYHSNRNKTRFYSIFIILYLEYIKLFTIIVIIVILMINIFVIISILMLINIFKYIIYNVFVLYYYSNKNNIGSEEVGSLL